MAEVDAQVKKAGTVRRGLGVLSDWRMERQIKKAARQKEIDEEASRRVKGEQRVDPNIDVESVSGDHLTFFNNMFLDSIRRGQSRTDNVDASDDVIRDVVCDEIFIQAIANGAVKTPLEEVDTEYEKEMVGRRIRLAQQLRTAREHREYMLGELTFHELDIIYSTMIGSPQRDSHGRMERPGSVELWDNERRWSTDKPKPYEAFFRFLESVAIRERPESKGEFIGSVLKDISARRSMTGSNEKTMRSLTDGGYINEYLYAKSAYPIDTAVENFHRIVSSLIVTPTTDMHPTLEVPGIGYDEGYRRELERKRGWVEEARPAVQRTEAEHAEARDKMEKVETLMRRAEEKGSVTLQGGVVLKKGDIRLKAAHREASEGLKTAELQREKAVKELKRREDEVAKFEREASPEAFARELADHFKMRLKENRDANVDLDNVGERMRERLPNIALTRILTRAAELLEKMSDTATHFHPAVMQEEQLDNLSPALQRFVAKALADGGDEGRAAAKEILDRNRRQPIRETDVFAYKKDDFEREMARFATEIESARLPEEVKLRLRAIQKCTASLLYSSDEMVVQIKKVEERYAYPVGRVVKQAMRGLKERSYSNIAGITDADKIMARMTYEARTPKIPEGFAKKEGRWHKFFYAVKYHLFTSESYVNKARWLWQKTFADEFDHLRFRNWFQWTRGKKPDGTPYTTRVPRIVNGIWGLTWKGWIVGGMLAGYVISRGEGHWYNPLSWPAPAVRAVGGPFYVKETRWWLPLTWTMPLESERRIRRVIHDSYDIPQELPNRGNEFYRDSYGVGHRLPNETNDDGARARLQWLQRNPDVLRFFQERRSGREVTSVRRFPTVPERCSSSAEPIPRACERVDPQTPLRTAEQVANYTPVDNDHWTPGMPVCCTVEIESRPVQDGLRLNTSMADRFVETLRAAEAGHQRVDYAYISSPQNRGRWVTEWYLYTPAEDNIVHEYGIHVRDNVRFVLMQGENAGRILLPRCSFAQSPEFIDEAHRDEFVTAFRAELGRSQSGVDMLTSRVEDGAAFETAFSAVKTAHPQWVRDITYDYQRRIVRDQVHDLHIQTETAIDVLQAQPDILSLVRQFADPANTIGIDTNRSDEFIQVLSNHKLAGGDLNDFNPLTASSGAGSRVQWAVNMGYLVNREAFHAEGSQDRQGAPAGSASAGPATAAPSAIPILSPDGQRFYSNQSNEGFRNFLEGVVNGLHEDSRADGHSMQAVLASRFGGNRDQMDRAIKANVFLFLTSTRAPDVTSRNSYGLQLSGSGGDLHVELQNPGRARTSLRNHVLQFVRRLEQAPSR
jgi:hypothetical protein